MVVQYMVDLLLDQNKGDELSMMQDKGKGKEMVTLVQGEKALQVQQKNPSTIFIRGAASKRKFVELASKLAQTLPNKKRKGPKFILYKDYDDDDEDKFTIS